MFSSGNSVLFRYTGNLIILAGYDAAMPEYPETNKPRRGRPVGGKRSDPAYKQHTLHLSLATMQAVKLALIQRRYAGDTSDLVEELLKAWLDTPDADEQRT